MAYPLGVITRTITVGDSLAVESGTGLTVRATLRSSRGLVWIATGERAVPAPEVRESATAGDAVSFAPPVTDQAGWRDLATGALIDVSAPNAHTHTYTIELVTFRGARPVDIRTIGPFPLPTGDGSPVDADLLVEADTVPGLLVSVPDAWGGMVAAAEAAAEAAAKVAEAAALDYFAANPPPAGDDGREVELRTSATHIQWRLEGDSTWLDIIELADLVGASGPAVELRTTATHIQWRVVGAVTWTDLVLLESLRGPAGREVELQTTATHIQWRYVGSPTWTDLVSLAAITGDDGLSVELQTTATHIQWRLVGGDWADLVALSALVGPAGPPNTLSKGTVTTGPPGSNADFSITGTAPSQVLNLTIPAGAPGAAGAGGGVTTALYLSGTSGNGVSIPSTAALRPATELDVRVYIKAASTVAGGLIALGDSVHNVDCSWALYYSSSTLRLRTSPDGSPPITLSCTVTGSVTGAWQWVRFTYTIGSPKDTCRFYTSTDGISWTQQGPPLTKATIGAFYATPNPLTVGTIPAVGGGVHFSGILQKAEVRDGIDGPLAAAWDGRAPAPRYRDPQGNIWTVNGTANAWSIV